jgi:flavin-dependent dehydrogenase
MERRPILIVGAGPAGTATALHLHRHAPELAGEILVLEKATHPRFKVCAGGLIPHALDGLRELDVALDVPHAVAHRATVTVPGHRVDYEGHELCRIVRRDWFDHLLARTCRERGIEIREAEPVIDLRREGEGVRVETERGSYLARVLVGADGSGSLVRRRLVPQGRSEVGKAIMTDVPCKQIDWDGFTGERYDFSFAAVPEGLRGYSWAFPCMIDGEPHANIGVYSVRAEGYGPLLHRVLRAELDRFGVNPGAVKSFPIRWYGRGTRVAAPHVLLAGDAAGVDALMGEGISFGLEYGRYAAQAAARALRDGIFDFQDYEQGIAGSWFGKKLRRLALSASLFYGPTSRLWFGIAAGSRSAREIGIRWYNGVDGWDRRSGWQALGAWWKGEVTPPPQSIGPLAS